MPLHRVVSALALATLACAPSPSAIEASGESPAALERARAAAPEVVPEELLVRFVDGAPDAERRRAEARVGAERARTYRFGPWAHVRLPRGTDLDEARRLLARDPAVAYAEPNAIVRTQALGNDPLVGSNWGLDNQGQAGGTADADINAPEAWDVSTGDNVVVGIVDTGIDLSHDDLQRNLFRNPGEIPANGLDDDANGYVDDLSGVNTLERNANVQDDNGHGTHVAGIVGAVGSNAIGSSGVAPGVRLAGCKAFDRSGRGPVSSAVACLDYFWWLRTRPQHAVRVVATNNSWGDPTNSRIVDEVALAHLRAGILLVAAAGNGGTNSDYQPVTPASLPLPNVVAVAATDSRDLLSNTSNLGRRSVHLAAPGVGIFSTYAGNTYAPLTGTSQAAPFATGVAALLASSAPLAPLSEIRNRLLAGGTPLAPLDTSTITGRRLRAWDTNGRGALTCAGQQLQRRLRPLLPVVVQLRQNAQIELNVLNIDCGASRGELDLAIEPGARTVKLADDGQGPDLVANDGVLSASWTPPSTTPSTLRFPGGDDVPVLLVDPYLPAVQGTATWRALTSGAQKLSIASNASLAVTAPFPLRFGGSAGTTTLFVSDNGVLSLSEPFSDAGNQLLPRPNAQTLIAPFWDDLETGTQGGVYAETLGAAPAREFVLEWRGVQHQPTTSAAAPPAITFQVVFREERSELVFNYQDVVFGGATAANDRGASATIGVQVTAGRPMLYSTNNALLRDGLSLTFHTDQLSKVSISGPSAPVPEQQEIEFTTQLEDPDAADAPWLVQWDYGYNGTFVADDSKTLTNAGTSKTRYAFPYPGRYAVAARAIGARGISSELATFVVTVESARPVVSAITTTAAVVEGALATLEATLADSPAEGPWRIEWDFAPRPNEFAPDAITTTSAPGRVATTRVFDDAGPAAVAVRAIDAAGRTGDVVTRTLDVAEVRPTLERAIATPVEGDEPLAVRFTVDAKSGAVDAAADPIRLFSWDFESDGTVDAITSSGDALHVYRDGAGADVTARVTVSDEDESVTTALAIRVRNLPPAFGPIHGGLVAPDGMPFQLALTATDSAGTLDPLRFSLVSGPEGASLDATGTLRWIPREAQSTPLPGTAHAFRVAVEDDDGGRSEASFTVTATVRDDDGDGLPNAWESFHGSDPSTADAAADANDDGVSNLDEYRAQRGGPPIPPDVQLVSPAPDAVVRESDVTFEIDSSAPELEVEVHAERARTQLLARTLAPEGSVRLDLVEGGCALANDEANAFDATLDDGDEAWWRARSVDEGRGGRWSELRRFVLDCKNTLPDGPFPISPGVDEVVWTLTPLFTARASTDPDGDTLAYAFELFADDRGTDLIATATAAEPAWRVDSALEESRTYWWRVSVRDRAQALPSPLRRFRTGEVSRAPAAPSIRAPVAGARIDTLPVRVEVAVAQGVPTDHLEVELSTTSAFSPVVASARTTGDERFVEFPGLAENQHFHVRARVLRGERASDWATSHFVVDQRNDPPSTPTPISPASGALLSDPQPVLAFEPATDPDDATVSYALLLRDLETGTRISFDATTTRARVPAPLGANHRYAWSVTAVDARGLKGPPSPEATFVHQPLEGPEDEGCSYSDIRNIGLLAPLALVRRRRVRG